MGEYMKLPEGKTCADCVHLKVCRTWEDILPENIECRFRVGKMLFEPKLVKVQSEN